MRVKKVGVERFSVTSSKPVEAVVATLEAAVGKPDMVEFAKATKAARTFGELERAVHAGLDRTGLMMFMKLDPGAILRKEHDFEGYGGRSVKQAIGEEDATEVRGRSGYATSGRSPQNRAAADAPVSRSLSAQ